ncbi:MAG: DUF2779 domain-containing protein [Endomicrobium sp.]|nr:DUF2779 domain-containing protein [Endomicrobium sp.]
MTKRDMLPKPTGLSNEFLYLEWKNVRKMSWQLFPDAVNVKKTINNMDSLSFKKLIQDSDIETICDAQFTGDGYSTRVDILQRLKLEDNSWHLFGVKSGSRYKAKYIRDIAFSVMVLTKSGINVHKTTILYLSNDYRLGMDASKLFTKIDCTEKVELKMQEFLALSNKAFKDIESKNMPEPCIKTNCKNCPTFDICIGKGIKNHIFDLPRLSKLATEKLIALGVHTIDKIPDDFEFTQMQTVAKNCVLTNTPYVSDNLKIALANIEQPFYYLDFESVTTVMPLYPEIAPHTQLLTQFSLDKADSFGNILDHYEYIADQTKDCRREIAEKLIKYLGESGSIITYANAESIAILKLADLFSDLSEKLDKIAERIVDLELIIRKNYYDINFHGRTSIKKVLPVLISELSYANLKIDKGGDASAAFAFMAMGLYDEKKVEETKRNLLKYCAQDTLAMVHIHQFLINIANNNTNNDTTIVEENYK